jgi:hypothetical protein
MAMSHYPRHKQRFQLTERGIESMYPRKSIVGRAMIVGAGGGAGYDELAEFASGAVAPLPPGAMGHPAAPPPPGMRGIHPSHPAHPGHPHHHAYHAWYHGQAEYEPRHMRGVPVAYSRNPLGPMVREEHPTHTRAFPIGFAAVGAFAVGAGLQAEIDQKPQVLYRGERLAVPASLVGNFDFNDLKVGKDSQLAAAGIMPTECFSNLSVGVRMELDTAEPGILISLFVTNNAATPQNFQAVLYGTVIE